MAKSRYIPWKCGYGKLSSQNKQCHCYSLYVRDYVSVNYWPNKDAGGAKLREMYQKLHAHSAKPVSNGN